MNKRLKVKKKKVQATKGKRDKLDIIKILMCYTSKDDIKKMKRLPTEWKKEITNHMYDEGYELLKFSNNKKNPMRAKSL